MGLGDDMKNFHFIKDKAYTEDEVLVYNLFLYNLPKSTTKHQLLEYFKKFGEIASVRLLNDRNRPNLNHAVKIGFVNFTEPQAAAKVLQNPNHTVNRRRILVRACDSWHQPDAKPSSRKPTAEDDSTTEADEVSYILNINDDCLEMIFKHLEMNDQVNLAGTCQRLRDVFIMHSKIEYKTLDLTQMEFLTLWEIRQFLEMTGPQIEKLVGRVPDKQSKRVIEFLGTYCTKLKTVSIQNTNLTANVLRKLLKNMQMITDLELYDVDLRDSCIPVLKNLKQLKVLSVSENVELTGKHIQDLSKLTSLSFKGCRRVCSPFFKKICENQTELNKLDIQECTSLQTFDIQFMVKHLLKLEHLKISCDNVNVACVATLPSLKILQLYTEDHFTPLKTQLFADLAKYRADQMETLGVYSYNCVTFEYASSIGELKKLKCLMCPNNDIIDDNCLEKLSQLKELEVLNVRHCKGFTRKGLLDLIRKCNNLKTLNVASCKALGDEFARNVLELLKSTRNQRDQSKPLKILSSCSGISPFVVRASEFETETDLLKFSFDYQIDDIDADCLSDPDSDLDDFDDEIYLFNDHGHDDEDYFMYFSEPDDNDDGIFFVSY